MKNGRKYYGTIYEGVPSTPASFSIVANNCNRPLLTWNANIEPDLANYQVWRKWGSGSWFLIASPISNSYTDNGVSMA